MTSHSWIFFQLAPKQFPEQKYSLAHLLLSENCLHFVFSVELLSAILIEAFAVEEGDNDQIRKHLHAIMKVPEQMSIETFAELLQQKWIYGHIQYYEIYGEQSKFVGYLLKDRSKSFIADDVVHF